MEIEKNNNSKQNKNGKEECPHCQVSEETLEILKEKAKEGKRKPPFVPTKVGTTEGKQS